VASAAVDARRSIGELGRPPLGQQHVCHASIPPPASARPGSRGSKPLANPMASAIPILCGPGAAVSEAGA
jgi:hypothetical protein